MRNLIFILSIVLIVTTNKSIKAQSLVVTFEYDAAGNRVKRSMQAPPPPCTNCQRESIPTTEDVKIEEPNGESKLSITAYPNPTEKELVLSIEGFDNIKEEANFALVDLEGRMLKKARITNKKTSLDLSSFPKGTYYLNVTADDQHVSFKIIKI
jgi:hypothetical protein